MKYDYFVAGRWRNRDAIAEVVAALRASGEKGYCFIENSYDGDGVLFSSSVDADPEVMMSQMEALTDWRTNPTFRKMFDEDMNALKVSEALVLVFPAGLAAHMELGAAYGMGKKCYAIGQPEKPETLYLMLDGIFPDTKTLLEQTK